MEWYWEKKIYSGHSFRSHNMHERIKFSELWNWVGLEDMNDRDISELFIHGTQLFHNEN